jgi:hypothetical protein
MGYFTDTEFDSVADMMDAVNEAVEFNVRNKMAVVNADELGLDIRAGSRLYVDENYIVVRVSNSRALDYYGGFEYVDNSCVQVIGDFKFYSSEDERVQGHIDHYFQNENS